MVYSLQKQGPRYDEKVLSDKKQEDERIRTENILRGNPRIQEILLINKKIVKMRILIGRITVFFIDRMGSCPFNQIDVTTPLILPHYRL